MEVEDVNKRFDAVDQQFAEIREILREMSKTLESHGNRIATLEERTSLVRK